MNKCLFLILSLCVMLCGSASAQKDPKAEQILNQMSAKYKTFKAFKAEFTYTLESANASVKDNFKGDIIVKGDKYFLKLAQQEVYNNGVTVWTYMREENEVNITDYAPDEDDVTPTKIYTMYKKGFKYVMSDENNENKALYYVIDLIPEDKTKQVFKIRITINKADSSIKKWKVFEKNGNRYNYAIAKFTPNPVVDDKAFVFDKAKYKGVQVVDLR
jgi:outer membrane lipoprotein carrier protein